MRTCAPLFCISGTNGRIALKLYVWLRDHLRCVLEKMEDIHTSARKGLFNAKYMIVRNIPLTRIRYDEHCTTFHHNTKSYRYISNNFPSMTSYVQEAKSCQKKDRYISLIRFVISDTMAGGESELYGGRGDWGEVGRE